MPLPDRRRLAALAIALLASGSGCATVRGTWGSEATVLDVRRPAEPERLVLTIGAQRIGTLVSSVELEQRGGERVLVARSSIVMSADYGTGPVRRTHESETVYEGRAGGRLLAFSVRLSDTRGGDLSVDGRCEPGGCVAEVEAAGRREERRLPPPGETAEQADAARLAAAHRATVTGRWLNPETLEVVETHRRFVGEDTVLEGGVARRVAVVEEVIGSERQATILRYALDGRLLSGEAGQVQLRADPNPEAGPAVPAELASAGRIVLPTAPPLAVPARVTYRVRGVPRAFQIDDARQRWSPQPDGTALVTVTARLPAAILPEADALRGGLLAAGDAVLLAPTLVIDADEPSVQAAAREITADTAGAYAASLAISRDLSARLEPSRSLSRSRASDVLRRRRAGPRERTVLFTALARAAGVPCRLVGGLAHVPTTRGPPALYWRPWVEVRSGAEWIALDPVLGQPVADATHLALARDGSSDVMSLLGTIEVLEVQVEP